MTPADLRPFLGILDEGDAVEDAMLQSFIDAAWSYCCRFTRRDLTADFSTGIPADLEQAHRMIAIHFFSHREATASGTVNEVPLGARDLLSGFRDLS
ncbi:head-tail connector protein [Pacificoceanicola onchidii]|uniref:head-tail connector protein n=1 Tax=Pacificoceanicola onchidii TaxID=2562685 RepID=UPI0010A3CC28|nr:head-tail connector protein [Pacificoceanicola onchidii]